MGWIMRNNDHELSAQDRVLIEVKKAVMTKRQIADLIPDLAFSTVSSGLHRLITQGLAHSVPTGENKRGGAMPMFYHPGPAPAAKIEIVPTLLNSHWGRLPSNHSMAMASI